MANESNTNPHAEAYGRVIEMLGQARTYASIELEAPGLNFIRTTIDADLRRLQQKLQAMGGEGLAAATIVPIAGTSTEELGPVTHIMGQKVNFRKPIQDESLQVGTDEKAQFLARRDAFLEQLPVLSDEDILAAVKMPGAAAVIRNIARRAGLEDYREAPLDIDFIGRIREGLKAQEEQLAKVNAAEQGAEQLKQSGIEGQELPTNLKALYPNQENPEPEVTGLPKIEGEGLKAQEEQPKEPEAPKEAPAPKPAPGASKSNGRKGNG